MPDAGKAAVVGDMHKPFHGNGSQAQSTKLLLSTSFLFTIDNSFNPDFYPIIGWGGGRSLEADEVLNIRTNYTPC
jgi:hypothetical protein